MGAVVQLDVSSVNSIPQDFSVDEDFVLAVIEGLEIPADICIFLKSIPPELLTNRTILLAASKKSSWIWHFAQKRQRSEIRRSVNIQRNMQSPSQCAPRSSSKDKKGVSYDGTTVVPSGDTCESPSLRKELHAARRQKQQSRQQRRFRHMAMKGARMKSSRKMYSEARKDFVLHRVVDFDDDVDDDFIEWWMV